MYARVITTGLAGVAATALVSTTGGASVAAPDRHAPCLAHVFQDQAVSAPRVLADRILEIRDLYLGDDSFGQVLVPLTRTSC